MMKKKVLAMMCVATMVMGMTACGGEKTAETPAQQAPAQEAPAQVATEAPAQQAPAQAPAAEAPAQQAPAQPVQQAPAQSSVYYETCADARAAGAAPLHRGEPGYRPGLDKDGDGVACEPKKKH